MKKIFVYYSNSGNGDYVSQIMKSKGFDILKIEPVKDLPNNYTLKILIGGFSAMIHKKEKIKNDLNILNNYDFIYVGTPIWNARVSSPINTVLDYLKNKKFNFICYSGSGKTNKIRKQLNKYNIEKIISLVEPLKHKDDVIKILDKYIN